MGANGWTADDVNQFLDLLIKANNQQLQEAAKLIVKEAQFRERTKHGIELTIDQHRK